MLDIDSLYKHTYVHLKTAIKPEVVCFFKDCFYLGTEYDNFRKHHSAEKNEQYLKEEFFLIEDTQFHFENDLNNDIEMALDEQIDENVNEYINYYIKLPTNRKNLINFYLRLFLKLKDKYLIASYKCEEIFDDIDSIIKINNSNLLDLINHSKQTSNNNDKIVLETVVNHLSKEMSLFEDVHSNYKFESKKENWKKQTGFYVEPIEIKLNDDATYQYVPILDSLTSLFKNRQLADIYFKSNETKSNENNQNKIKSFNDSLNFAQNELFQKEKQSIQIVLFTDGYDTTNPLGDQRNTDRINATYFRIGNLDNCYQSINHLTQTSILCTHDQLKAFGYSKIHEPLINDLKILETEGIEIIYNDKKVNLKGTISFLPADNLAANGIGGYVECFSQKNHSLLSGL